MMDPIPYSLYPSPSQILPYGMTASNSGLNRSNNPYETMQIPSYYNYTHNLEETKNKCKIRFYHGTTYCKKVDLYINGMKTFKEIPFNAATSYLSLSPGSYYIEVFPTGTTYPLIMHRKIMIGDTANTLILSGAEDDLRLVVIPENRHVPHHESKVKTLHLAPSCKALQISVKGRDVLYQRLPYKHQTDYLGLTPMSIEFELKDADKNELLLNSGIIQFHSDKVYMMIIFEDESGNFGIRLLD